MQLTNPLLLVAVSALAVSAQRAPPKPQQTIGPDTLNTCTACATIVKSWAACQSIDLPTDVTAAGKAGKECLCTDAWYGSSLTCRDCLMLAANQDDPLNKFYDSFSQAITNMVTSCTNAGGSVTVKDGYSCAWAYKRGDACIKFGNELSYARETADDGTIEKSEGAVKLPQGVMIKEAAPKQSATAKASGSDSASATKETGTASADSAAASGTKTATNGTTTSNTTIPTSSPTDSGSSASTMTWTVSAVGGAMLAALMAML